MLDSNDNSGRTGPKNVIVLGAGLAGLAAAYELAQAGHEVTVLEARPRPGGRVLTLRDPFSDGLYAEGGAIAFSDLHVLTRKYARLFGLPLDRIPSRDLPPRYYLRGKRITVDGDGVIDWPLDLTDEERRLGLYGVIDKYVEPAIREIGDPAARDWPPEPVRKYDGMTFAEFLMKQGASPGVVTLLTPLYTWWGDGPDSMSALFVLRDSAIGLNGERWYTIKGGNDLLPRAFAARLAHRVRYEAQVLRIEQDQRGVRVVFLQSGRHQTVHDDYAVCTIPYPALRHIEVSPSFSPGKRKAIKELPYTSVARVYVQARTRFWLDGGPRGWTYTDLPIMNVLESTASQPGVRGIVHCLMTGARAREMTSIKETDRIDLAVREMDRLYPGMRANFEAGVSKCWDEDEWSLGGYPWFKPGQIGELMPHIIRPEGRVHFAGDNASACAGWMQGALESGNRAAAEIMKR